MLKGAVERQAAEQQTIESLAFFAEQEFFPCGSPNGKDEYGQGGCERQQIIIERIAGA